MKLKRSALKNYIDTAFNTKVADSSKAVFEILGKDIEEMSVDLSPDTSPFRNILDETRTVDNGYTPTIDADPFYADPESALYPKIRDIAFERLRGDSCKTLMLEVLVEDTEATTHTAYLSEVMIKPTSYGGGSEGVNIPFTISEDGARVKGSVTTESLKSGSPVFTPASESLSD